MKKALIFTLAAVHPASYADDLGCASVGASMELSLFDAISKDLKIDPAAIQRDKTTVEIINTATVSELYAESLAKRDHKESIDKGLATIPVRDYFSSYYENNARSITAKYTYTNVRGMKDIFIASSLMNKDECSIRFNGYLTLAREF
ncbi:Shiga toxin A subunit [Raoultella terrigena]|uniref:Shiga toxin A subunit n=1 Tax=Raoultella terrigena TaxID=577 RepID=UPI001430838A|nr:Shiga toxin A subunit [Raoultella terrigena]QIT31289.1 Shiga toxin A subunit [Raoultella terrigena]